MSDWYQVNTRALGVNLTAIGSPDTDEILKVENCVIEASARPVPAATYDALCTPSLLTAGAAALSAMIAKT